MSLDAHLLMFRTMFDPATAAGFEARVGLRLGGREAHTEVADGTIAIGHGAHPAVDATIATDSETLVALLQGERKLTAAMRSGDVAIEGDRKVATRFLTLFPLPEPAVH
jgi:putative sterol carrier protein